VSINGDDSPEAGRAVVVGVGSRVIGDDDVAGDDNKLCDIQESEEVRRAHERAGDSKDNKGSEVCAATVSGEAMGVFALARG
jgi:hypothetical protein